jgi:acyl carrier protein
MEMESLMAEPTDPDPVEHLCATLITYLVEELDTGADLDPATLAPDVEYESLDFDSLVLVELALGLQQRFGVEVTHEELVTAASVRGTAELLVSRGAGVTSR